MAVFDPKKKMPSARLLRRLIDYDSATGEMRWKERPAWMFSDVHYGRKVLARMWNTRYAGKPAFTASQCGGYKVGRLFDRGFLAHRVAWAIHNGMPPTDQIDHINGDRSDNRIENLRAVSNQDNAKNAAIGKANTSGVMGVFWCQKNKAWVARIKTNGKTIHLLQSKDKRVAIAARKAAERKYGFHPNHGRAA